MPLANGGRESRFIVIVSRAPRFVDSKSARISELPTTASSFSEISRPCRTCKSISESDDDADGWKLTVSSEESRGTNTLKPSSYLYRRNSFVSASTTVSVSSGSTGLLRAKTASTDLGASISMDWTGSRPVTWPTHPAKCIPGEGTAVTDTLVSAAKKPSAETGETMTEPASSAWTRACVRSRNSVLTPRWRWPPVAGTMTS